MSNTPALEPAFRKPKQVIGRTLDLRNAEHDDAEFIVSLRTDPEKGRYLSRTSNDVTAQEEWLARYQSDPLQLYFIIADKNAARCGTVRLYDQQGDSFCWGSWILKNDAPAAFAIESALLVYRFAQTLGFRRAHFDVRRGNESVWRFHERFGAVRTGETEQDFLYKIDADAIESSLKRYRKYLPEELQVVY